MAKILLVEDDNNLREIFEMRLKAEGYTIVTAHDGEQALVVAMQEKPDLVISDVMMPKLSGFEMIETLKAAPEMKNVKVIMMTALGQAEDRSQGDKLGVDRYLVKSQVTLEDFVNVTKEVLEGTPAASASADPADPALKTLNDSTTPAAPAAAVPSADTPVPNPDPAPTPTPAPDPVPTPSPAPDPAPEPPVPPPAVSATPAETSLANLESSVPPPAMPAAAQPTQDEAMSAVESQINTFVAAAPAPAADGTAPQEAPAEQTPPPEIKKDGLSTEHDTAGQAIPPSVRQKRLEPISDMKTKPDLEKLVAEQDAKDNYFNAVPTPTTGAVLSADPAAVAANTGAVFTEEVPSSPAAVGLPDSVSFSPTEAPVTAQNNAPAQPEIQPVPGMVAPPTPQPTPSAAPAPAPAADQKSPLDPNTVAL